MAYVAAPGYMPVHKPTLPCHHPFSDGLHPGMTVYIQGMVTEHASRFMVNFACDQGEGADVALQFNPLLDQGKVVLNTSQAGKWGNEESHDLPFQKGERFEIVFTVTKEEYQILVNGKPFCSYKHRIPPENVKVMLISGDLELQLLSVMGHTEKMVKSQATSLQTLPMTTAGATIHPMVPYTGSIGPLNPDRTIVVAGFIENKADRFEIDFMAGSDIALHINPRMRENIVVRNSFLNGSWGPEERELPFNPLRSGQYFELSICCDKYQFKVYLNGEHFFDYGHRYVHLPHINTLHIEGDVLLSYICY